jgi:hypothetical protein
MPDIALLLLCLSWIGMTVESQTTTPPATSTTVATTTTKQTKKFNIVEQLAKQQPVTLPAYRTLKIKVPPTNYTGPSAIKSLLGQCFHSQQGSFVSFSDCIIVRY